MSFAMNKSGAAQLIADFVVSYFSDPYILFGVLMLVTGILTNIMSNTATTAIMVPLVIPIAPVSYTHLDVYKRQPLHLKKPSLADWRKYGIGELKW